MRASLRRGVVAVLQATLVLSAPAVPALAADSGSSAIALTSLNDQGVASSSAAGDVTAAAPESSAAPASTATAGGLQEVIVTATRREEALSKVPISVQAITNTQMELAGVRQIDDLVRLTPEVKISYESETGSANVSIRGISSDAGASTTGVYIDDTPIQVINRYNSGGEQFPTVFDLQRVEVLRGPQGTLFGAGAEGGTVRFIQEQPSLTQYTGYARAEGAGTDGHAPSYELGASYGGPLVEDLLGFRVSAYYRQDGGYIDEGPYLSAKVNALDGHLGGGSATVVPNTAAITDNVNWTDTKSFRAALRLDPTQGLTITPSFYYQRQDRGHNDNTFWLSGSNPSSGFFWTPQYFPGPANPACSTGSGCNSPGSFSQLLEPTGSWENNTLSVTALNVAWNIGEAATFTSTTSYTYWGNASISHDWYTTGFYAVLENGVPGQTFPLAGQFASCLFWADSKAVTQELRLNGTSKYLNWLVGAFYSHDVENEDEYCENNMSAASQYFYGQYVPPGGPPFGPGFSPFEDYWGVPLLGSSGTYEGLGQTVDDQFAGFVQVDVKFTPIFSLTAGIRAAHDKLSFSLFGPGAENNQNPPYGYGGYCPNGVGPCPQLFGVGPYAPSYPGGIVTSTSRPVTPKVALNAQLTGNNLVYLSATKGFRIGGGQLPVPNYCGPDLIQLGYVKNGVPYTPPSYNPDYVWSYELGTKNTAFDGRLTADASVFYVKWQSIQTNIGLPICGYDVTTNAGTATVKGFDLDAQFVPIRGLQLRADLGYAHSSYDEGLYTLSGGTVYSRGSAIDGAAPPWQIVVSGRYEFPLKADINGYFYADDSWINAAPRTGRTDPAAYNFQPYLPPYPAYNTADLRLGMIRGPLDVSFFMNNILNARPLFVDQDAQPTIDYVFTATTLRPRTLGVTAAYRF